MGAPEVKSETAPGWWRSCSQTLRITGSNVTKVKETSEFGVALGSKEFVTGQHEFEFSITRLNEGYVYIGVAVPGLALDQTFCRRDAIDQVWYYFGCGYTNALRNGWNDVVSKEIGGSEMKIPKLFNGDKVRVMLDMDAGQLRFALYRPEDGAWKELPGQIDGIKGPVVAACCLQERLDAVSLSESARVDGGKEDSRKRVPANDKYAHVQSKLSLSAGLPPRRLPVGETAGGGGASSDGPAPRAERADRAERAQKGDRSERGQDKAAPAAPRPNIGKSRSAKELCLPSSRAAAKDTPPPPAEAGGAEADARGAAAGGTDHCREAVSEADDDRSLLEETAKARLAATWERASSGGAASRPDASAGGGGSHQNSPREVHRRAPEGILPQVAAPPPHRVRMPGVAGAAAPPGGGRLSHQSSRGPPPMKENGSVALAREAILGRAAAAAASAGGGGGTGSGAAARQRSNSAESVLRATAHDEAQHHYPRERLFDAGGPAAGAARLSLRGAQGAAAGASSSSSSAAAAAAAGAAGKAGAAGLQAVAEVPREDLSLQGHNRFLGAGGGAGAGVASVAVGGRADARRRKQHMVLPG